MTIVSSQCKSEPLVVCPLSLTSDTNSGLPVYSLSVSLSTVLKELNHPAIMNVRRQNVGFFSSPSGMWAAQRVNRIHTREEVQFWSYFFILIYIHTVHGFRLYLISGNLSETGSTTGVAVRKVRVEGGAVEFAAGLQNMQPSNPEQNWEIYTNWADSVRSFPGITTQKVSKLSKGKARECVLSSNQIMPQSLLLVLAAAATVRPGEGGSVCRREEALPSPGHWAVPLWEWRMPLPALQEQWPGRHV